VETTVDGKPVCVKLGRVRGFSSNALSGFAKRNFDRSCQVVSDGLVCFASVTDAGCTHQAIKTGSGWASAHTPAFNWVNTALGNIKALDRGNISVHQRQGRPTIPRRVRVPI
jgi:hypothetical protein